MRTLEEQDHYEVLEIPHGAHIEDIERAYPIVRAAYEDGALATYSVFGPAEKDVIRERIDYAYQVLTDVDARAAYDHEIGIDMEPEKPDETMDAASALEVRSAIDSLDAIEEIEDLEDEESGGTFDGPRLRRTRLRRGIELEQISELTRINPNYLRCIEEDAFVDLPAAVYTRGFVTAYARAISLDPQIVAKTYMERFNEARGEQRNGGLMFGRRERS